MNKLLIPLLFLSTSAFAHMAEPTAAQPEGWSYDTGCCSTTDCRPVPDNKIIEMARGYIIRQTGELIPYGDTRLRNSPDGRFHWCSANGKEDTRTICLYVPPRGF